MKVAASCTAATGSTLPYPVSFRHSNGAPGTGCDVRCSIPMHCAAVRSRFAASIRPTVPATYGLAMLVPLMDTHGVPSLEKPLAAPMSVPGAATSGLHRPSLVGPWLLVTFTLSAIASRLATAMTFWPHANEEMECEST